MDKPKLRNALKKLRAVPFDRSIPANVGMAPQEMLDYLAMLAGIKPVFLLGRGFDDPQWVEGVTALARRAGLHVIEGPKWDATPVNESLPTWLREHLSAQKSDQKVFYICRAHGIAAAVESSIKNPPIAIEEEARLLGYPPCCVHEHYERDALFDKGFYLMLDRTGRGDIKEMQRILREDIAMSPETPEENDTIQRAIEFTPAPFTSFHLCAACAADPARSAWQISKQYEELARAVDEGFAAEIAASQKGVGRYD